MSPKTSRVPVLVLAACLLLPVLLQAAENQADPKQEFQALLERVKKSDASVDFARMRHLQTLLDDYHPYGADIEAHPLAILQGGNAAGAQALVDRMLEANYLDLEAQFAAAEVADKRGDKAAAVHHRYVLQGVLDSILHSGDGKSPETAFVVVTLTEEYALMNHLGLRVAGQSLLNDDAGHSYDLLQGVDGKGKPVREVYFNIDALMGALSEEFSE